MTFDLECSPEGSLIAIGEGSRRPATTPETEPSSGCLLLDLATVHLAREISPPASWAREWGRRFLARLCQTRDPDIEPPPESDRTAFASSAPPFPGAEYATADALARWWREMAQTTTQASANHPGGLEAWLREKNPAWHLVGRVSFHLAENKSDSQRPFAFLATYTEKLSEAGQPRHQPLARALRDLSGANDRAALENLLSPVRTAASRSPWLRDRLADKRLFQPMALTPPEAYAFLRETPVFQDCGIVVKLPDWWHGGRPSRPKVGISIDAPKDTKLDARSLLSFNAKISLDGEALTPAEIEALLKTENGLVSLRGRWVEVDARQLGQALAHWREVERAHAADGGLDFHGAMRLLSGFRPGGPGSNPLDHDPTNQSWTEVIAGKNLAAHLARLREPAQRPPPASLHANLRPYQATGLSWLAFLSELGLGACLADDMGLGKTIQVLGLLLARYHDSHPAPTLPSLLVVPASLVGNWLAECRKFAPDLRVFFAHPSLCDRDTLATCLQNPQAFLKGNHDVLLTTYQILQRAPNLRASPWLLAILDEAQTIKNPGAATTKAVKEIQAQARIALTGTPVENRPGDLWSLFDFLNPGLLGNASAFAHTIKSLASQPSGFAPLRNLVQPYLLRRLKTDRSVISDLPEKTELKAWCGLTKRQAKIYTRLVEDLARMLTDPQLDGIKRRGLVLSFLMKFKQVCNHPSQWSGDGSWIPADSGKFTRLAEICAELADRRERVLVFTQFQEMCDPLARHLSDVFGRPGLVLHGGTPVKKRAERVAEFQEAGGPPFFVISVKAGGTGLNLTAASHVIHFDRWWNPAVENQATDRAFRIGQKKNVFVHKFVCQGTMEERVDQLIEEKKTLASELLGRESGADALLTEMDDDALLRFVSLDLHSATLVG